MQFDFVDVNTISSLVVDLDVHKAAGADGLSPRMLKASPYMVRLITILVNKCIASSSVSSQWKQANVTPVPKCENCTTLSHFRPISVLPTLPKILECVLFNQIVFHLNKYDLLTPHQSGFRAGYSTQDVLLYVTDIDGWLRAVDESNWCCVFGPGQLRKAFDTVDHTILRMF